MTQETSLYHHIFIVHALKGYEFHEARIRKLFAQQQLPFEFVTDGDPSHMTDEIRDMYFVKNINSILSPGVLSCTLNHFYAYKKMVERQLDYAIVFENDPFFLSDFKEGIQSLENEIKQLPKGFILSLENSTLRFPSYWQTTNNKHIYQAKSGRMAGAYLLDLEAAKRILSYLDSHRCNQVIDWFHNTLIDQEIIKMYWAHPALVEQGSHNGRLHSTISSKPSSLKRRLFWLAQKWYKTYLRRLKIEPSILVNS